MIIFSKHFRLVLIPAQIGYLNYCRLCYQAVVKTFEGCTDFKMETFMDAYLHLTDGRRPREGRASRLTRKTQQQNKSMFAPIQKNSLDFTAFLCAEVCLSYSESYCYMKLSSCKNRKSSTDGQLKDHFACDRYDRADVRKKH